MKKYVVAAVGVLFLPSMAFASFTTTLQYGSQGSNVTALQQFLVLQNCLTAQPNGNFGPATKAAVSCFQKKFNISPIGVFGPQTRAAANSVAAGVPAGNVTTTYSCPVGWSCTAPAAITTTTVVNQNLTTITTPGVSGSLTIAKGSFTGNGTIVNDGQSVDISSYDLQAGASDEKVSAVSVDFNVRPWLYINTLSLYNAATGATLATVSGLTQANFTELTVGSDYRLTIPNVSLVVPAGQKITVVLHAQFAVSNRSSANIYASRAEVRAIDGTGVTITQSIGTGIAPDGGLATYVAYGGQTASNIIAILDPQSPPVNVIQTGTGTTQTKDVPFATFDLKSQNVDATLQGLTTNLNILSALGGDTVGSVFANVQLYASTTLLASGVIATPGALSSTVTFTNFNLPLPSNTYVPVTVFATIQPGVNFVVASSSMIASASNIIGIDANQNALTISNSGVKLIGTDQTLLTSGNYVYNLSWNIDPPKTAGLGILKTTTFNGGFTITAVNQPIYISSSSTLAFVMTKNIASSTATISNFVPANGVQSNDVAGFYTISPGGTRSFTLNGTLINTSSTTQNVSAGISTVYVTDNTLVAQEIPWSTINILGLNSDFHKQVLMGPY